MKKFGPKFFAMGVALGVLFLFSSVPEAYPQEPPSGIYVGLLSFSGDVTELIQTTRTDGNSSNFIAVDIGSVEETILQAVNAYANRPVPDNDSGAALFYAVHKAMDDLVKAGNEKRFPGNVDSIYIVTITDSYDNASAAVGLRTNFDPSLSIPPEQRRDEAGYSAFIKEKLSGTKIKIGSREIPIQAYSLGLPTAWRSHLESIASNPAGDYVTYGSLDSLKRSLSEITKKINGVDNQMIFSAVFRAPFKDTGFRFKIDEKHYIDGTVNYKEDGTPELINITSVPETLYRPGSVKLISEGNVNPNPNPRNGFSFDFTINGGNFRNGQRGRLYRINGADLWEDTDAQLYVHNKPFQNRRSAVVYFLLDNSKSMVTIKNEIRDSLNRSINYFRGVNDNP